MTRDPIFIHASPRSGSTYFFNVLRRNPSLMCFNEAISDVYHIRQKPKWDTHHNFGMKAPFYGDDLMELKAAWAHDIIPPPYPTFYKYNKITQELEDYISDLIQFARSYHKRPVFCEIYSRYRVKALREKFGGFHIVQIRDFIPQFGSFIRALVEGGEWGFLALPWLENEHTCIDAIACAASLSLIDLQYVHSRNWTTSNKAAIRESNTTLNLDHNPKFQPLDLVLDFSDYKKYPPYPIPSESEWRKIVRKHRPNFKIAVSKLPLARHLYGKLNQWRRPSVHSQPMPDKLRQFLLSVSENSPSP